MNPKLFVVRTVSGTFRSEHDTMDQAVAAANQANEQAKALGVEARYEAHAR